MSGIVELKPRCAEHPQFYFEGKCPACHAEKLSPLLRERGIAYCGEVRTRSEWARILGMHPNTLYLRLRTMTVREAFETPVGGRR